MTNREMLDIVQQQLAFELGCTVADLNGEKDSFVFAEAKAHDGILPVPEGRQYFGMLTMGKTIIVTATPARLKYAKEQLTGKSRDDAFSMPFICGHSLSYLPDLDDIRHPSAPGGFVYETVEKSEISKLWNEKGFNNALQADRNLPWQNTLVMLARQGDAIVAMAGAGGWERCPKIWGIGIDVLPAYRKNGLAVYLVNRLATEVLRREIVPLYGTNGSNLASQRVAYRAGFKPAWMCDHRVWFEGELRNA